MILQALQTGSVALDTPLFIYFIEKHPRYANPLRTLFQAVATGEIQALASELVILETLVKPYRDDRPELARDYEAILSRSKGLTLINISRRVLRTAALLRARHTLRTADAIHLASCVVSGCRTFLTNDRRFPRSANISASISIVQLDDLIEN